MRWGLVLLCALALEGTLVGRASAGQVCAWIVETLADDGDHKFDLELSADAAAKVAVKFVGDRFTSASMGGELIELAPGEAKDVDNAGYDVNPGDDLRFEVQLWDTPMASLEEMDKPKGRELADFVFERKVGEGERAIPGDLAVKQCKEF